jgi:enamine deaminase RidA (YjgF/YER057c/UK114 family)
MARQIVSTPKAARPPATYNQAVKAAGLGFVSGTGPVGSAGPAGREVAGAGARTEDFHRRDR